MPRYTVGFDFGTESVRAIVVDVRDGRVPVHVTVPYEHGVLDDTLPTAAGKLPAKYVFHAVGPVYRGGDHGEAELLASCYRTCLKLADERAVQSISFPSISTGVYGYPAEEAAVVAIGTVLEYLKSDPGSVREATFVLFDVTTYRAYERALLNARAE